MKKIFIIGLILLLTVPCFAAVEWSKADPAGTRNASDIDYYVGANNSALDRVLANYNTIVLSYDSAAQLTASIGEVVCSNSDGSTRKMRQNTVATTITWADIDAGAEAGSTTYYVYANADADATTATFKISLSATAPTGVTSYKRIGSFYNDASSNITLINNTSQYSELGTLTSKSAGTTYQALTDGMVVFFGNVDNGDYFTLYTDSSSTPTTAVQAQGTGSGTTAYCGSMAAQVKKGDYYKITIIGSTAGASCAASSAMYWIPSN